jgi:hypothetical protein
MSCKEREDREMTNLALVSLNDLKILLSEHSIPNEVWNSKQAAEFLTVSVPTLHKEAEIGNVPGVRIGKDWKFSSIALYQYVAKEGHQGE